MNEQIIDEDHRLGHRHEQEARDPLQEDIGTNTMQMHSSETNAGTTICAAPSMIAVSTSLPCSRCQLMFSIVTVASSTRMPTASARPPSVMMLSVSPNADRQMIAPSTDSGMDTAITRVERPAAEEQQHHHAGQQRCDDALERDTFDRRAHEQRLVVDRLDRQRLGQGRLDLGELLLDAGDDVECRCRAVLQHRHQHRTCAVDMHDIGLRRVAVAHVGDVADVHGRAIDHLDRHRAEFVDRRWRIVELHGVFERADLLRADRRDQVLCRQRVGDVLAGQSARLQRGRVEVDLHLAALAAERIRDGCAFDGDQARAHDVEAKIGQRLLGKTLAGQRQLQDRHSRRVVVEDQRRRRADRASAWSPSAKSR